MGTSKRTRTRYQDKNDDPEKPRERRRNDKGQKWLMERREDERKKENLSMGFPQIRGIGEGRKDGWTEMVRKVGRNAEKGRWSQRSTPSLCI